MPSTAARQTELTKQLRDAQEKERLEAVADNLKDAVAAAEQIPLRTKTQFMLYPETRTLMILKAIAEADETTVQEFVREAVDKAIEQRLKPPPTRKRSKRTTKKGA